MKTVQIPEGYQQVMPYLIVPDGESFLKFTHQVFEATEKYKLLDDEERIRHAEVFIGESVIMFGSSTKEYPPNVGGLFIYVDDADKRYQLALKEGAKSIMEPEDREYGRTCGVIDSNGNTWWITSVL
ncbi:VOC family protein [Solitalea longa]|uniref:VOC family protein n=1 Tax=Solitalea longa TaxID=2079460 RepID=A0A2S5A7N0_9SPHI|nr:VOC family protein [Solitalea longa]POY38299.1 VOC family protein [Solitalea longa]